MGLFAQVISSSHSRRIDDTDQTKSHERPALTAVCCEGSGHSLSKRSALGCRLTQGWPGSSRAKRPKRRGCSPSRDGTYGPSNRSTRSRAAALPIRSEQTADAEPVTPSEAAKSAIIVYGKRVGTIHTVCTDNNCPVHDPRAAARLAQQEQENPPRLWGGGAAPGRACVWFAVANHRPCGDSFQSLPTSRNVGTPRAENAHLSIKTMLL